MLAKYANTIPLSNQSLFGGGLKAVVAKAASAAWDYAAMTGFIQAGLYCPKLPRGKKSHKRAFEGTSPPFSAKKRQPTSGLCNWSSSSKRKRPTHERALWMDSKSSMGPKSSVCQKPQQKGRKGSKA